MTPERKTCESCGSCCTKINGLGVTMGGKKILANVNLHIHCGELTLLIGPNGAGKTTLLRAILGEIKHEGTVDFLDHHGKATGKLTLGYVPQKVGLDAGSPVSVFDLFASCISNEPVFLGHSRELRQRILADLAHVRADHLIDRKLGNLSGGELQKVLLSLALDPVPRLLLLDEPLRGMDSDGLRLFYSMVSHMRKHFDLAIILVSHDFQYVADYADRVVCLNHTIITSGTPEKVFRDKKVWELFGPGVERYARKQPRIKRKDDTLCWDRTCKIREGADS
jgi:zinc transport system ATP-binding protein